MNNRIVLEMTSGSTSFFSCAYRPGATKAHTWYSTTGSASRKPVISMILSGTMNGEITEVAISVAPLGRCATSGAARMSYSGPGPGYRASTRAAAPTAASARSKRSRSSIRCVTNGCSVPASSSSGILGSDMGANAKAIACAMAGNSVQGLGAVAGHARSTRQGLGAHAGTRLVPLGDSPALESPVLARGLVFGRGRLPTCGLGAGQASRGFGPVLFKVRSGGLHRLLDIACSRLHRLLHFFQLFEVHGPVDLGLDIGHVALGLAQQRAHRTGHARQFFGTDDDQCHRTDQRHLGKTEVQHDGGSAQDLVLASTSMVVFSAAGWPVT